MTPRAEVLAWERIARAFAAYAVTGKPAYGAGHGLCGATLWFGIPAPLGLDMRVRLRLFGQRYDRLWWPRGPEGAGPRALFAQLMAELAREEQ